MARGSAQHCIRCNTYITYIIHTSYNIKTWHAPVNRGGTTFCTALHQMQYIHTYMCVVCCLGQYWKFEAHKMATVWYKGMASGSSRPSQDPMWTRQKPLITIGKMRPGANRVGWRQSAPMAPIVGANGANGANRRQSGGWRQSGANQPW